MLMAEGVDGTRGVLQEVSRMPTRNGKDAKREREFTFSSGNRKLARGVLIWNLPRLLTCPGAGQCVEYCYEKKIERIYPGVKVSRQRNLEFSKREDFVQRIVEYLRKRKERLVRIHESGDFYSRDYLEKWKEIARQVNDKIFLAYSKSYHLDNFWDNIPDNLRLIQSVESKWPHLVDYPRSTARVIEKRTERKEGEFICPEELAKKRGVKLYCGENCKLCWTMKTVHVCFIRH